MTSRRPLQASAPCEEYTELDGSTQTEGGLVVFLQPQTFPPEGSGARQRGRRYVRLRGLNCLKDSSDSLSEKRGPGYGKRGLPWAKVHPPYSHRRRGWSSPASRCAMTH